MVPRRFTQCFEIRKKCAICKGGYCSIKSMFFEGMIFKKKNIDVSLCGSVGCKSPFGPLVLYLHNICNFRTLFSVENLFIVKKNPIQYDYHIRCDFLKIPRIFKILTTFKNVVKSLNFEKKI